MFGNGLDSGSYSVGTDIFFRGVKRPGHDVDHLPPSSVEVKNKWSYTATSLYMRLWRGQGQV
jgi:hypothetical protein